MRFLVEFLGRLWSMISGKENIQRLENEIKRLHQRNVELQAYSHRLEMEIKRRNDQDTRDKKWKDGDQEIKRDMLKSRFRDR